MCGNSSKNFNIRLRHKQPSKLTKCHPTGNRYKVTDMIEHDNIAMTTPTSIPCEDGFLAPIVKYFNLSYFIKTETKLYHNYMILKLRRCK